MEATRRAPAPTPLPEAAIAEGRLGPTPRSLTSRKAAAGVGSSFRPSPPAYKRLKVVVSTGRVEDPTVAKIATPVPRTEAVAQLLPSGAHLIKVGTQPVVGAYPAAHGGVHGNSENTRARRGESAHATCPRKITDLAPRLLRPH